jgi:4-hydroxy-tetrahydrodipicolinate synthase
MIKLHGSFVALVTPYRKGDVDLKKLAELVEFHAANGTSGICPAATTGEGPVLSADEKAAIIRTVVKTAKGKMKVFPGTGTYDTADSIAQTKMAKELGADGALMVTPYYNKPTQEGLYRHYEAVAKAVDLPIMLYTVPGRTAVNIAPETTARLSKLKNIVAIKDASGNVEQVTQTRRLCDLQILSGEDSLTFPMLCLGAVGVVSVAANIIPKQVAQMVEKTLKGDIDGGREIHDRCFPVFKDLFLETNPIPVKTALKMMGMYDGEFRLPMCEMSAANAEKLEKTLKACKLV